MPTLYFSFRLLGSAVIVAGITLSFPTAVSFAQSADNPALVSTPNGYPVDVDGAEIHLGSAPVDGDLTITGNNALLVLDPGEHVVNGNATINAENNILVVNFDKEGQYGSLKVNGALNLGPENAPTLSVDLSSISNLMPGAVFSIALADEIHGEFSGLSDGTTFTVGDVTLRINYTGSSIIITVISSRSPWERLDLARTPITDFDNSLINPTSTAPGS